MYKVSSSEFTILSSLAEKWRGSCLVCNEDGWKSLDFLRVRDVILLFNTGSYSGSFSSPSFFRHSANLRKATQLFLACLAIQHATQSNRKTIFIKVDNNQKTKQLVMSSQAVSRSLDLVSQLVRSASQSVRSVSAVWFVCKAGSQ